MDTQDGILRKFVGDRRWAVVPNGKVFRETFSGRKDKRPVLDEVFDYIKKNPGKVDYFVFRVIDRFTRGGSYSYEGIKQRLAAHGVEMIDTYGVIQPMKNTLEHVGLPRRRATKHFCRCQPASKSDTTRMLLGGRSGGWFWHHE